MLIRSLAVAAAFVGLSAGAYAGTLQNGAWTPNCTGPGDPPTISSKNPDAYNKTAKEAQAWQQNAQNYANCINTEAKADQNAVVNGANGSVSKLSDQLNALKQANDAAIDKLKKGQAPH